ncbi:MAG: thiamine-phosphate kinase [Gammaproteobacteria bacterium]|nr:thiamine-phosphate kinase [Gammaproteobacteria bacterium]
MNEFELIDRFFAAAGPRRTDVVLGIGDDAAVCKPPSGMAVVMTIDTLVAGRHFLNDVAPDSIGHKALAVSLSDLAAMGAQPAWALLSLSLPKVDEAWLEGFAQGFFQLAEEYGVQLAGGDTVAGELAITVQLSGFAPEREIVRRSGAGDGHGIFVTGTLGDAALALEGIRRNLDVDAAARARLERPSPRVREGLALRGLASAAIDVSDGLLADLGHVLRASRVGAQIDLARLPLTAPVRAATKRGFWKPALQGGDDYELCFTLPDWAEPRLRDGWPGQVPLQRIGTVESTPGLRVMGVDGQLREVRTQGFDHFAGADGTRD